MTLAQLEDRAGIEDLFVRYMWAIDNGDVDTLVGCFTEDGSLESPAVGAYTGRAEIAQFAKRFARFRERGSRPRHVISNLLLDLNGDTAFARCYLVVFLVKDGASRLLGPGDTNATSAEWMVPGLSRGAWSWITTTSWRAFDVSSINDSVDNINDPSGETLRNRTASETPCILSS